MTTQTPEPIGFIEPGGEKLRNKLPWLIAAGLDEYALYGYVPGDFLKAVLANDLIDAVCRADAHSLAAIADICRYVYNFLPSNCHGSREKYVAWVLKGERSRKNDIPHPIPSTVTDELDASIAACERMARELGS